MAAIGTNHRVSTFRIPALVRSSAQLRGDSRLDQPDEDGGDDEDDDDDDDAPEHGKSPTELAEDSPEVGGGATFSSAMSFRRQ